MINSPSKYVADIYKTASISDSVYIIISPRA